MHFNFYSPSFYWMESQMNLVIYWFMAFLLVILIKIILVRLNNVKKAKDSMVFTEAIGLPLTFMQPIVFYKSILDKDWFGSIITIWWGPGFLAVVILVLGSKILKKKINWGNSGIYISWLCKLYYLAYIILAFYWNMPKLIFALSAWIASDQIEKSFASLDADRTRRTFHDFLAYTNYVSELFIYSIFLRIRLCF